MRTTSSHSMRSAAPVSTRFARARWWASTYLISLTGLVGGTAALLAGEPVAVAVCLFAITVIAGTGGLRARAEFRRGWRQGFESAARMLLEHQAGRTSDLEVRFMVDGDPTPEPWDEHVPPAIPRSVS